MGEGEISSDPSFSFISLSSLSHALCDDGRKRGVQAGTALRRKPSLSAIAIASGNFGLSEMKGRKAVADRWKKNNDRVFESQTRQSLRPFPSASFREMKSSAESLSHLQEQKRQLQQHETKRPTHKRMGSSFLIRQQAENQQKKRIST